MVNKCSIVILNWNGRPFLERFLPSVTSYSEGSEIVVADNGSMDDSLDFLLHNYPQVRVIVLGNNYGFADGYNRAMREITSEYAILLNSDVEVSEGWLDPLLNVMDANPSVAAVMPKVLSYADRSMFEYAGASGGFIDMFGYPFCRGRVLQYTEKDAGQYDDRREVFWATGACMVVRTSVFHESGGFDADFFAHQEEIDLCWRMKLAGYKIMVEPSSEVYHIGGGTLSAESPRKVYLNHRNNLMMLYKNLSPRSVFFTVFFRLILDGGSALVYLLKGNFKQFKAVFSAHFSFYGMLGSLSYKRKQVQKMKKSSVNMFYRGSVVFKYFTGRRTFSEIVNNKKLR